MYLEVENLVKSYGNNPVIKNLTFSIEKGQLISFVGESGSGKSTFLKCLSGLENINSGIYVFENIDGELEIIDIISLENTKKIKHLGLNLSSDMVFLKNDNEYYNLDDNYLLKLVNEKDKNIKWSNISTIDKDLAKYYLNIHQGKGVSLTRILTELHNGKFFGSIFTLILFFSSLSLIFLTLSSFIFATNMFKNKKK